MTFLAPWLLYGLPLAALPIVVHLIHLYRRRQVRWAAMMFLLAAQRMNKGLSRLRQILILALRVLAVAALIFVVTRPLAGGWLGLTGGAPDTVLVLLDRSSSMEQQNTQTGVTKRIAGMRNLSKAINDAVGTRSRLVVIDSAFGKPVPIPKADAMFDLPQTAATDTRADIPGLLQNALDYVTTNKTGRTDVWLLSDLQATDWDASGGRWEALRKAFGATQGVRFHLLCYPQSARGDLAVTVERVERRETPDKAELLLDLQVTRSGEDAQPAEVPLRFVINGAATTAKVTLQDNRFAMQGYAIPIDKAVKRGWGRVELPNDAWAANNAFHFVFDEPAILRSVIVSDDPAVSDPLVAALNATADPSRKYAATVLPVRRAAEIPWADTALVIWQAPFPKADDALAHQLHEHATAGRAVIFLPPDNPDDTELFGLRWGQWVIASTNQPETIEWWRNDADLLANTRDGTALPVGALEISRRCALTGDGVPLARVTGRQPLLMRSAPGQGGGAVYFLGTLPATSSLARDGVVMFALTHRALGQGALTLGRAQARIAGAGALGPDLGQWQSVDARVVNSFAEDLPLHAGVFTLGERLVALNHPPSEDVAQMLSTAQLGELFAGLDFQVITDSIEDTRSLTNEVWRTFLIAVAATILGEALLCLPGRRELPVTARPTRAFAAATP